ncbi:polysaccharide biosynthesis tyrosine autokinase [bacterium BD-1]|nr:polysaccharide biosynthesis tyrosine autokinase [Ottowia caeni]
MSDHGKPPDEPHLLPPPNRGPQPAYAVGAPTQAGLGQPWQAAMKEDQPDDDVIDLSALWRMVVKHKWMLVSVAVVGLLAALLVSFTRTPQYQAATTLQVDKRAASVVKFGQEMDTNDEMDDRTGIGTQLQLLKSRALAERVVDELRLDRSGLPIDRPADPSAESPPEEGALPTEAADATDEAGAPAAGGWRGWANRFRGNWTKLREPSEASQQKLSREGVIRTFQSTVNVEQVRNSRLLKIAVDNPDPRLAARIANTVAQAFISLNLERRMEASSYAKTFLEQQLALTKAKLEESERRLNEYARSRNILTLDEKTNTVNQTYTEYSSALVKAEQERIKYESEYQAIKEAPDTAVQVLQSRTVQEYKAQRTKLETDYQQNLKIYKENFPLMVQLRVQISELDSKIKAEVQGILRSVGNQLNMAKQQEGLIRARLQQTRQEIMQGQDRQVDYNLLKREVDTNRELYDGLLQQVKEVGVAGGVETNNIQVVDKAEVPLFPYKPNLALNSAIGLLAGLVLGLMLVFLIESLDDSIKFADEVEKTLGLPLLGVIPHVKDKNDLPSLAFLAHTDPRGHLAEAYRSTRTALQFSSSTGAPRVLLVTSTTKNEGKSTTALALAISFAQLGGKVALIDSDMRNPTVHKLFQMSNNFGLSSYLAGQDPDKDLLRKVNVPNLTVITAGPVPPSPVDLLMGPLFGELITRLQAIGYEHIVVDGPPVLGLADAIVLGNQIPAVLYVAQASRTRMSHIKDALRRLRMAGINPRGVVLTKTTSQNTAYYTYDNYYGYGVGTQQQVGLKTEPSLQTS